jgi:hypothetical protein
MGGNVCQTSLCFQDDCKIFHRWAGSLVNTRRIGSKIGCADIQFVIGD